MLTLRLLDIYYTNNDNGYRTYIYKIKMYKYKTIVIHFNMYS